MKIAFHTLGCKVNQYETQAMRRLLEQHGIMEMVRTGIIALERGQYTITEDTKEKGEFNYGKNVL